MAASEYDVIVVGARCAGSPTALLLAQKGYRVLVVDRTTFPSDTVSTHVVHPTGVDALRRWGLVSEVVASGCPAIDTYSFDFGPLVIEGSPGTRESPVSYCPRRTVLDKVLVDGAAAAGAEVREGFGVDELVIEDGRVVGIRGRSSGGAEERSVRASWSELTG
jgi:flavin-dependent dehydrogenase